MMNKLAIRFARKGKFIPNIEVKFPKNELDEWSLANRLKVVLNNKELYTSRLELQIPFKLFLGSEKDIEDAKHLYDIFSDKLDIGMLKEFNKRLKVEKLFNKYMEK
jgi:hypothetical protein